MAISGQAIYFAGMRLTRVLALGVLLAAIPLGLAAQSSGAPSAKTEIVRWSPFTSDAAVKKSLTVREEGTGRCSDTYTTAGDIAYRCSRGNYLYFPCWRDGPHPTSYVVCIGDPWSKSLARIRSPGLLHYPGVTFRDDAYSPWAIELESGERCRLFQGAHSAIHRGNRTYVVDYYCNRRGLVLVRNLRRGTAWRIGAAHFINLRAGYKLIGDVTIRRAFFGALPPPMERQRKLAARAVAAARDVIHRVTPHAELDITWVRLTLPDARWAYVMFSSVDGRGRFALLHRNEARWVDTSSFKPYCTTLSPRVRDQLFLGRDTWNPPPYWSQAPPGEARC